MKSAAAPSPSRGNGRDETSEDAEAKAFWDAFFAVFGVTRCPTKTMQGYMRSGHSECYPVAVQQELLEYVEMWG